MVSFGESKSLVISCKSSLSGEFYVSYCNPLEYWGFIPILWFILIIKIYFIFSSVSTTLKCGPKR